VLVGFPSKRETSRKKRAGPVVSGGELDFAFGWSSSWSLDCDDFSIREELASPDTPRFAPLLSSAQARYSQGTSVADCLCPTDIGNGVAEKQINETAGAVVAMGECYEIVLSGIENLISFFDFGHCCCRVSRYRNGAGHWSFLVVPIVCLWLSAREKGKPPTFCRGLSQSRSFLSVIL